MLVLKMLLRISFMIQVTRVNFPKLNSMEAEGLEAAFFESEVFLALREMNGDKASRLDGFTSAFWQFS